MKRYFSLILLFVLIVLSVSPAGVRAVESQSIYGPYDTFEELYTAYMQAVEDNDVEEQAYLLEIGRTSLQAEIAMSEGSAAQPAYDAVKHYWVNEVFPQYFSYGYFETRNGEICLTLGSKLTEWSADDKDSGWVATRMKFQDDSRWDNTEIMKEQFYCHARKLYAAIESEWNLEPWRTSMNPFTCN